MILLKNVAQEEHKPKERESDTAAGTAISLWMDPVVPPPPAAPEWHPRPPSSVCATAWPWGKMESQKIEHGDGEDRSFAWRYRCMPCVKREQNFQTDGQAWAYVYETQGKSNEQIIQAAKFEEAKRCIKATFEAVGIIKSKRAVYQLTRSFMMDLFSGIASYIVLKSR